MPGQRYQTNLKKPISPKIKSRYIDSKTDFAFKHLFAKEHHLDLLKDFLNSVFQGRKVIENVELSNTEHQGNQKEDRKTIFDVCCTSNKGEKFVVEMQQGNRKFFKDRMMYYTANLIQEQGYSVDTNWGYELPEVYFIAVLDFCFEDMKGGHYIHDVRLIEINTNRQFYDKLGYIFVELPGLKKTEVQLETNEDNWLFCLKNMDKLKEIPLPLRNNPIFKKLFKIAEVSNLNQKDMNAYEVSLMVKRDHYSIMETVRETSYEQGIKQSALDIAHQMKKGQFPVEKIVQFTKLSIEEIKAL